MLELLALWLENNGERLWVRIEELQVWGLWVVIWMIIQAWVYDLQKEAEYRVKNERCLKCLCMIHLSNRVKCVESLEWLVKAENRIRGREQCNGVHSIHVKSIRFDSIPKIRNRFVFLQLQIFDIFWWLDLKIINKDGNHYSWMELLLANINIEYFWVKTQIGNEVLINILLHISWFNMKSMWNIIESLNHWTLGNQLWSQLFKHRSFCMNRNIGNDEFIEIDWIISIFELNWFLEVKSKSNQINVWFLVCRIILFDGILGWIDRYWYVNMIIIFRWILK